jgi:RNA recognition motif-containing protein
MKSPRISANSIHEWIFESLILAEDVLHIIQIDGPNRNVYLKFKRAEKQHQSLQETKGQHEYKHENGEISKVTIEPAGMGIRTIRIQNLPPEVNDRTILNILTKYGEVRELKVEQWSRKYRYKISNGIRIATMNLKEHIPSYVTIANNRVLVSYDGQPPTCYGCSHTGH